MAKKCWICNREIVQSAIRKAEDERYYSRVQLVNVNTPYSRNSISRSVYVCHKCSKKKIGLGHDGKNLNPIRHGEEYEN